MQQLLIEIADADVDLVSGWLFEIGVAGFEERNSRNTTSLVVYSEDPKFLNETQKQLARLARGAHLKRAPSFALETTDSSSQHAWLEHLKPEWLTEDIVIHPVSSPPPDAASHRIVYQPELAFGTGGHATTQLAARQLTQCLRRTPGVRVLDVGSGNGVLCFVALIAGADTALGIDVDPRAVQAAVCNQQLNGYQDRVQFATTALDDLSSPFELVVANIDALTIASMAPQLSRLTTGSLLVTGFLLEQEQEVQSSYRAQGMRVVEKHSLDDWCLLELTADLTKPRQL